MRREMWPGRQAAEGGRTGPRRWPAVLALACLVVGSNEGGATASPATGKKASPYVSGLPDSARTYYAVNWGIDQFSAKLAESGQLVRFNYRVVDVAKATPLNEKSSTPLMLDEKAGAVLHIPEMEQIGLLRQSGPPESGKSYWMVFSNKGSPVKAGHRVSVVIGQFRVDGLVVH